MCGCAVCCCGQVTTRQAQEEPANAGRSRRGLKTAQEQSSLVRDTNVEVISMMLQALEKEHRGLLNSLQGPIIAFIMDMLPVRRPAAATGWGCCAAGCCFLLCSLVCVRQAPGGSLLISLLSQDLCSCWQFVTSHVSRMIRTANCDS
jgi:hypothetical protein